MSNESGKAPLTWEQEREQWKKAMELQKEGFLSRVQALEEELGLLKIHCEQQTNLKTQAESALEKAWEENKRLEERLRAAAIDFSEWLRKNVEFWGTSWSYMGAYKTSQELYEIFKHERYEDTGKN